MKSLIKLIITIAILFAIVVAVRTIFMNNQKGIVEKTIQQADETVRETIEKGNKEVQKTIDEADETISDTFEKAEK